MNNHEIYGKFLECQICFHFCSTHYCKKLPKPEFWVHPKSDSITNCKSILITYVLYVCDIFVLKMSPVQKDCQSLVTFEIENVLHEYFYLK